jgi:O-antigen ligase
MASTTPFVQNFYGDTGRNTGFLTYLFLGIIALGGASVREVQGFKKLLFGFFLAGIVNLAYGFWSWQVGDFVPWNNIYGNLLGTFGNPNFMGAFLGMFGTAVAAYAAAPERSWKVRLVALGIWILTFLEIIQTSAVQGLVLITGGLGLVGFYIIRSLTKNMKLPALYVIIVSVMGLIAVMGALQKGPLSSLIYKRSVSLRGSYWQTAIDMGLDHPFTGVGMDSFGTYYRTYRSLNAATSMPGPDTITNAAHNVFLDFFAYGGFPLFLSYLAIIFIAGRAILRITLRNRSYDPIFVTLAVIWICYQVQSIISINQIGLAIWGWLLSGLLVSYEIVTRNTEQDKPTPRAGSNKKQKTRQEPVVPAGLIASIGMAVGLILAIPPFTADYKYLHAVNSKSLDNLESALKPGYFTPSNIVKYADAYNVLVNSNLPDKAVTYSRAAVEFNPYSYDAWKILYYSANATPEEKALAKQKMIQLDPLNKANKELP